MHQCERIQTTNFLIRIGQDESLLLSKIYSAVRDLSLSLKHILSQQLDFKNELSALQHLAKRLGTKVICSSKFHAEIAGEGIEYCWGIAIIWSEFHWPKRRHDSSLKQESTSHCQVQYSPLNKSGDQQEGNVPTFLHMDSFTEERQKLAGGGAAAAKEFVDIEKMAKLQRAHCSAAYQDAAYKRSLEMVWKELIDT